ncbi:MAG TPA: FGGY-family carbohydrate kinase [Candidatus Acidoferrum sp.]|nr:FGGY-family carbohydrate kinase [Candidatus Acidoferrum sp.]
MRYYMGIDVGTYESKGVLCDEQLNIVAGHSEQHGMENPAPNFFEHDAEVIWWGDFCKITNALLQKSGVKNTDVAAVGASALGADLVPVDRDCVAMRKAILYGIDARANKEIDYLNAMFTPEQVLEFNGRPLCSNDIPPKILWLKNNEPDIWEKAHKLLTGSSYLTAKLTGAYVIDRFLAFGAFTPLYNPAKGGEIDEEFCKLFCRPDQLAAVRDTTDLAGGVTEKAAAETGLAAGTPVIVGADDSGAEAISTGVFHIGDMMLQFGSSLYMIGLSERIVKDRRIWSGGFIIPGACSVQGGTNAAGTLTRWYRDNVFFDKRAEEAAGGENAYALMMEGVDDIPPGSDGLVTLPYIAGERTPINDPYATGVLFGLSISHTRRHMYRSALEAIGYTVAQHLDIFRENGVEIRRVLAVGGGTKNPYWLQMIADITDTRIDTAGVTVGASFGDAAMAAIGVGDIKGFAELETYIKPGRSYEPDLSKHALYAPYAKLYRELYEATKTLFRKL